MKWMNEESLLLLYNIVHFSSLQVKPRLPFVNISLLPLENKRNHHAEEQSMSYWIPWTPSTFAFVSEFEVRINFALSTVENISLVLRMPSLSGGLSCGTAWDTWDSTDRARPKIRLLHGPTENQERKISTCDSRKNFKMGETEKENLCCCCCCCWCRVSVDTINQLIYTVTLIRGRKTPHFAG